MFFCENLKTVFKKPSEISKEEEKKYYCIDDVPDNGIAVYNKGYFISCKAFHTIINDFTSRITELEKEAENKEVEYDKLLRKYNKLLDEVN